MIAAMRRCRGNTGCERRERQADKKIEMHIGAIVPPGRSKKKLDERKRGIREEGKRGPVSYNIFRIAAAVEISSTEEKNAPGEGTVEVLDNLRKSGFSHAKVGAHARHRQEAANCTSVSCRTRASQRRGKLRGKAAGRQTKIET